MRLEEKLGQSRVYLIALDWAQDKTRLVGHWLQDNLDKTGHTHTKGHDRSQGQGNNLEKARTSSARPFVSQSRKKSSKIALVSFLLARSKVKNGLVARVQRSSAVRNPPPRVTPRV